MQFDKGYISPYFVTEKEGMEAVLEDAYILLYEKKLSNMKDLLPGAREDRAARQADAHHRPRTSRARRSRRWSSTSCAARSQVCAVKAPGFGDRRKAMMEDIAVLTGGKVITEDIGIKLENVEDRGPGPREADGRRTRRTPRSSRAPARRPTSRAASPRSARRSKTRRPTTIARSCRSGSRSSRAASR
jgi:hypothetical protein